jgi:hypothetical protein
MPVTVKGIRVDFVNLERNVETGEAGIKEARYSLVSSTDHILAQQAVGSYGGMSLKPSQDTVKLLHAFFQSYKKDVTTALGLEES